MNHHLGWKMDQEQSLHSALIAEKIRSRWSEKTLYTQYFAADIGRKV